MRLQLLAALLLASLSAAAYEPAIYKAELQSAFIQRLLKQPFTDDHLATQTAVMALGTSGNEHESRLLRRVEQRRVLATLTGEPFEMPPTFGAAIEREASAPETLADAVEKGKSRVRVEFAPEKADVAESAREKMKPAGNGVWTGGTQTHLDVVMPLTILNTLPLPVQVVSVKIANPRPEDTAGYLTTLRCTPVAGSEFAPRVSQRALCKGMLTREIDAALDALVKRKLVTPLPLYAVETAQAAMLDDSVSFAESTGVGSMEGRELLYRASCEDKGTCRVLAEQDAMARAPQESADLFLRLALAAFLCAGVVAWWVKPRNATGGLLPTLAGAIIVYSALAVIGTHLGSLPRASIAFLVFFVGLYFSAIPFGLCVLALAASLMSGRVSRLRAFAATFGGLVFILLLYKLRSSL